MQRSDVRKPKKLLALDSVKDIWNTTDDIDDNTLNPNVISIPFNNKYWNIRITIQKSYDAFYAVQVIIIIIIYIKLY